MTTLHSGLVFAGRYRLEEPLGRGGMGEVWRGVDVLLGEAVAIKFLNPGVASSDPVWVGKFRQEARIAARLEHAGITRVDDFGEYADQWYLVMELLKGEDLARELARHSGGLPVARALSLVVQVADALAAAHERGVVHRDLKPGNLMLLANDRLKICDFGIARSTGVATVNTLRGRIVGTPAYMSPEQWRADEIDARSDLYALGCILFALLTGRPPYAADTAMALMYQHLNEAPPSLRSRRPEITESLQQLVLKLLAKNPRDRPADAVTVARELRRLLSEKSIISDAEGALASLIEAERAARTIEDPRRQVEVLAPIVQELAARAPRRASELVDYCENLAHAIPDYEILGKVADRGFALSRVAESMALIDLNRALRIADTIDCPYIAPDVAALTRSRIVAVIPDVETAVHIARSIDEPECRAEALVAVASKVPDRQRAHALLTEAASYAQSINAATAFIEVSEQIATAIAVYDPTEALRIAADYYMPTGMEVDVVAAIADHDPIEAAHIARTLDEGDLRAGALTIVATKDPDKHRALAVLSEAEPLARNLEYSEDSEYKPIVDVVKAAAIHDVDEALRIVDVIDDPEARVRAMVETAVGSQHISQATRELLLAEAEDLGLRFGNTRSYVRERSLMACALHDIGSIDELLEEVQSLEYDAPKGEVAQALAIRHPEEAIQIAHMICNHESRAEVLKDIALALAPLDSSQAVMIARSIRDPEKRALALVKIVAGSEFAPAKTLTQTLRLADDTN